MELGDRNELIEIWDQIEVDWEEEHVRENDGNTCLTNSDDYLLHSSVVNTLFNVRQGFQMEKRLRQSSMHPRQTNDREDDI